jgi:glycosyltransferase involved in cell wall biosynthesis
MQPSVSLLVAAYNEEASLEKTLERALATLTECSPEGELIVLDDCSRDRTPEIIKRFQEAHPDAPMKALRHDMNKGIARTFEDLYRAATKDYVFLISGDGEFPPEILKTCIPLLSSVDIVICRRVQKNYTLYRHIVSHLYHWSIRLLFGIDLFDPGGVKVVKREIFEKIPVRSTSVFVEAERIMRAVKAGYKIGCVDMEHGKREGGKGRGARFRNVWNAARDLFSVWWDTL